MSELYKRLLLFNIWMEAKSWDESKHPRVQSGPNSGEFTNSVLSYQSTNFDAINNELRYDIPDKYKKEIGDLDKAATDVTEETLYRGLDSDFNRAIFKKYEVKNPSDIEELKKKLIGQKITDKSFMSTSTDLNVAGDFARDKGKGMGTVIQISGKKKGINVQKHINNYKSKKEKEFILKRGTTLTITGVSISKTGKLILYTHA